MESQNNRIFRYRQSIYKNSSSDWKQTTDINEVVKLIKSGDCFIEVLEENRPVMPYFDLDFKKSEFEANEAVMLALEAMSFIAKEFNINVSDFCITESKVATDKWKSYHITIPSLYTTKQSLRNWFNNNKQYINESLKSSIDGSVYASGNGGHMRHQFTPKTDKGNGKVCGKMYQGEFLDSIIQNVKADAKEWKYEVQAKEVKEDVKSKNPSSFSSTGLLDKLTFCIENINSKRADDYETWLNIGFIINNSYAMDAEADDDTDYKALWHTFSKRSEKYDKSNVNKFWKSFRMPSEEDMKNRSILTIGSLITYLKDDNKSAYNEFIKQYGEQCKKSEYEQMKEEFEKNNCFIQFPSMYLSVDSFKEVHISSEPDFIKSFRHMKIKHDGKIKNFVNLWIEDTNKKMYEKIDFIPYFKEEEKNEKIYNLFDGYNILKKNPEPSHNVDIKPFTDYLLMLSNFNPVINDYLTKYIADIIQNPQRRQTISLVIKSEQGCGKGTLLKVLEKIIGHKYCWEAKSILELTDRFNASLANKLLIVADEVCSFESSKEANQIKSIISEPTTRIEYKGKDPIRLPNYARYLFFSNNSYPMKIEKGDRRYCFWTASAKYANNASYWGPLYQWLENMDNIRAIYDYLANIDLKDYSFPDKRPITEEHINAQLLNMPVIYQYLLFIYENKHKKLKNGVIEMTGAELYEDFDKFIKFSNITFPTNMQKFFIELKNKNLCVDDNSVIRKYRKSSGYFYSLSMKQLEKHLQDEKLITNCLFIDTNNEDIDSDDE